MARLPISLPQRAAMAAIVLLGLAAGGAVLLTGRHGAGDEDDAAQGHARTPAAETSQTTPHTPPQDARRVAFSDEQRRAAGITVQAAGPASLQAVAQFQGEIRFNDERTTHVVPRLAGVAESVPAHLGQVVHKGQVLAVIASTSLAQQRSEWLTARRRHEAARTTHAREKALWEDRISAQQDYLQAQTALQEADIAVQNAAQKLAAVGAAGPFTALNRLEIRAPLAGTVVEKHLSLGEAVREDASIFTVADLSTVWAEFAVAPQDLATVRVGQRVRVSSTAFDSQAQGHVSYIGALLGEQTRTARARAVLTNPQGAWRPGLFVTVAVFGDAVALPLTVGVAAVQTLDNQPTVFKAVPGGFIATPVTVGRTDGQRVEVLGGLSPGDSVAASNTFLLKSELGKASAEHTH